MATKFHPKREDGLSAYVITKRSWGKQWDRIEWAANLKEAKAEFGWTCMQHTTVNVRRATTEDVTTLAEGN